MASIDKNDLHSEWAHRAMVEGLKSHLQSALREQFEIAAKEVIDAAIANAMKTFDVAVQSHHQPMAFRDTIEVILRDRREEACSSLNNQPVKRV